VVNQPFSTPAISLSGIFPFSIISVYYRHNFINVVGAHSWRHNLVIWYLRWRNYPKERRLFADCHDVDLLSTAWCYRPEDWRSNDVSRYASNVGGRHSTVIRLRRSAAAAASRTWDRRPPPTSRPACVVPCRPEGNPRLKGGPRYRVSGHSLLSYIKKV